MDETLLRIEKRLGAIESLLQRLPEIQAAVFIQMMEDAESAKMKGISSKDLWVTPPPSSR